MSVAEGILLGALAGLSVYDIKKRKIPVWAVLLLGTGVLLYRILSGADVFLLLLSMVPGFGLLLLAFCTRESIGTGDGMVLCVIGLFAGGKQAMAILGMALLFASALAALLLLMRRARRKTELPFLPCLWSACLVGFLW